EGVGAVVVGGVPGGEAFVDDPGVALISATGSTRMGRAVAPRVAGRFGRLLLELGGNNASIVTPSADLELTARGIVFSAAGTAGQRRPRPRRGVAHSSLAEAVVGPIRSPDEARPLGAPREPRPPAVALTHVPPPQG